MGQQLFLIVASFLSATYAIQVDWNTNKGPIVPPTSTLPPVPKPPFREPAPVWEAQDDVPNPNPYQYVLPPPSRPKLQDDNYARAPLTTQQQYEYQQNEPNYGQIISGQPNTGYNNVQSVPSLSIQYVPNIGFKYHAIVPSSSKVHYLKNNEVYDKYTKLNGKYNPKLKKYKAYEKVKYVPYIIYVTVPPQPNNGQYNPQQNYQQGAVTNQQQQSYNNNNNQQNIYQQQPTPPYINQQSIYQQQSSSNNQQNSNFVQAQHFPTQTQGHSQQNVNLQQQPFHQKQQQKQNYGVNSYSSPNALGINGKTRR